MTSWTSVARPTTTGPATEVPRGHDGRRSPVELRVLREQLLLEGLQLAARFDAD